MEETICSEEPARSVSGAEALISKHNEHKAEIDARQDSMSQVSKAGRKLIQQTHYASTEVYIVDMHTYPPNASNSCTHHVSYQIPSCELA